VTEITRRRFCAGAGAGAGLVVLGAGCTSGDGRIQVGIEDDPGNGNPANPGNPGNPGGPEDLGGQPPPDLKGSPPADLANPNTGGPCPTGGISCGPASAVTATAFKHFTDNNQYDLYVCRDANGLYALNASCPHSGCTVKQQSNQFWCPCHSATFDLNGGHPTIPAFSSLEHYALCVDSAGNVQVDYNKVVPATTRA
jgi:nitrite reductase/ring-hydroxylating ferredoxin subunit